MFAKYNAIEMYELYKNGHFFGNGLNGNLNYKDILLGEQKAFSIDTPPPTVSGTLHMGHVYSYTHMDFIARYKSFCGKGIFYPIGYDDNGLPTEQIFSKNLSQFFDVILSNEEKSNKEKINSLIFSLGNSLEEIFLEGSFFFKKIGVEGNFVDCCFLPNNHTPEFLLSWDEFKSSDKFKSFFKIFVDEVELQLASFFPNKHHIRLVINDVKNIAENQLEQKSHLRKFFVNWSDFFDKDLEDAFFDKDLEDAFFDKDLEDAFSFRMVEDFLDAFEKEFFDESVCFSKATSLLKECINPYNPEESDRHYLIKCLEEFERLFRKNFSKNDKQINEEFLLYVKRFFYKFFGFFHYNENDSSLEENNENDSFLKKIDSLRDKDYLKNLPYSESREEIIGVFKSLFSGLIKKEKKSVLFSGCAKKFCDLFSTEIDIDKKKSSLEIVTKVFDDFGFSSEKIISIFGFCAAMTSCRSEGIESAWHEAKSNFIASSLLSVLSTFQFESLESLRKPIREKDFLNGIKQAKKNIQMSFECNMFFDCIVFIFSRIFFFRDLSFEYYRFNRSYGLGFVLYNEFKSILYIVKNFYFEVAFCFCSLKVASEFAGSICFDDKQKLEDEINKKIKENKKNKIKKSIGEIEKEAQAEMVFESVENFISSKKDCYFILAFISELLRKSGFLSYDSVNRIYNKHHSHFSSYSTYYLNIKSPKEKFIRYCISQDSYENLVSYDNDALFFLQFLHKGGVRSNEVSENSDSANIAEFNLWSGYEICKFEIADKIRANDIHSDFQNTLNKIFIQSKTNILNEYHARFKDFWLSLAMGFDFRLQYSTSDEGSVAIARKSFCDLYKKGIVYESKNALKPVHFDCSLGIAISQSEILEVNSESYFCTYEFIGYKSGKKYLIATTRPEMLPACVAVMFHPDDERYKDIESEGFLLTHFLKVKVPIISDREVKIDKGTGLVMLCTYGDTKDVEWMTKYSEKYALEFVSLIDERGRFQSKELLQSLRSKSDNQDLDTALHFFNGSDLSKELLQSLRSKSDNQDPDTAFHFFNGSDIKNDIFNAQEKILKAFGKDNKLCEFNRELFVKEFENLEIEDYFHITSNDRFLIVIVEIHSENQFLLRSISAFCSRFLDASYSDSSLIFNNFYLRGITALRYLPNFLGSDHEGKFFIDRDFFFSSIGAKQGGMVLNKKHFLRLEIPFYCEEGKLKNKYRVSDIEKMPKEEIYLLIKSKAIELKRNFKEHWSRVLAEVSVWVEELPRSTKLYEPQFLLDFAEEIERRAQEETFGDTKDERISAMLVKREELTNNLDSIIKIIEDSKSTDFKKIKEFIIALNSFVYYNPGGIKDSGYHWIDLHKLSPDISQKIEHSLDEIYCLARALYPKPCTICAFAIGSEGKYGFIDYKAYDDKVLSQVKQKTSEKAKDIVNKSLSVFKDFMLGFVGQKKINHAVKCSERSGHPIELIPARQYYVKVSENGFHDKVALASEKIKWNPKFRKSVIDNWLKEKKLDWCISRDRSYGTKIPVIKIVLFSEKKARAVCFCFALEANIKIKSLKDVFEKTNLLNSIDIKNFESDLLHFFTYRAKEEKCSSYLESAMNYKDSSYYDFPREYSFRGCAKVKNNFVFKISNFNGVNYILLEKNYDDDLNSKRSLIKDVLDCTDYSKLNEGKTFPFQLFEGDCIFVYEEKKVLDTWFTSSLSPQIAIGALNEKDLNFRSNKILDELSKEEKAKVFIKNFPFSLRTQAHEIVRTWAYYTIIKSLYHNGTQPWESTMISGWCLAEDNQKMSKSKGNIISPLKLIEEHGADVVRYWSSTGKLGADTKYDSNVVHDGIKLSKKIFNASKFVSTFEFAENENSYFITEFIDKFMMCKLNKMLYNFCKFFDKFEYNLAIICVKDSFYDFCDNYIEIAKFRAYGNVGEKKQKSALYTLRTALKIYLSLFCIFMPIVSNYCYEELFGKSKSVFDLKKDHFSEILIDDGLIYDFGINLEKIISCVRIIKSKQGVSIRKEIESMEISGIDLSTDLAKEFWRASEEDMRAVCNCKNIYVSDKVTKEALPSAIVEGVKVSIAELI